MGNKDVGIDKQQSSASKSIHFEYKFEILSMKNTRRIVGYGILCVAYIRIDNIYIYKHNYIYIYIHAYTYNNTCIPQKNINPIHSYTKDILHQSTSSHTKNILRNDIVGYDIAVM